MANFCFISLFTLVCVELFHSTHVSAFQSPMSMIQNTNVKRIHSSSSLIMGISRPSELVSSFLNTPIGEPYSYSDLLRKISNHEIDAITLFNDGKTAVVIDHVTSGTIYPNNLHAVKMITSSYTYLMDIALHNNVEVEMMEVPRNLLSDLLVTMGGGVLMVGGYVIGAVLISAFFRGIMGGKNNNINNMLPGGLNTQTTTTVIDPKNVNTTFADVAGCDEAKFELEEIVGFLKNPSLYTDAGAKIPKGVLLEGSPGTGKTLLARAVASEAGVPFISASGSEFIEMFVGVGAARVRSLFTTAKENAPCVVFIDEIDAIGRQRGAGIAGGNDEREQTLNQILTNMDGFDESSGIVVLGATNRLDVLDSALIRPGRFDRKIRVSLPDFVGRKQIANVHFRNKNVGPDVDFNELSSLTSGFSGADIANLANEAAIFSVRKNQTTIDRTSLMDAYEKVTIGLNSNVQETDKSIVELVSYHETGHALMVALFPEFFDVRKVTINGNKNGAGGYTLFTPKDKYAKYATKKFMLANLIIALGGRAAEVWLTRNNYRPNVFDKHVFKGIHDLDITTGASNDLQQATRIAKDYITKYGFSDKFGIYEKSSDNPFVGKELGTVNGRMADTTKTDIDEEVRKLLDFAYKSALELIELYSTSFTEIVDILQKERTIVGEVITEILANHVVSEKIGDGKTEKDNNTKGSDNTKGSNKL